MEKINDMTQHYLKLIEALGEDPNRDGLQGTPARAAKAMAFLNKGYSEDLSTIVNGALFDSEMDQMITIKNIEFYSLCEHHLLPFHGQCHIAYIPTGKVLGLSKFARIVEMYARRLQIQENLTKQIAEAIAEITSSPNVAVVIEAHHLCMAMRGVEKQNANMTTSKMLGSFRRNDKTRAEFLNLIK